MSITIKIPVVPTGTMEEILQEASPIFCKRCKRQLTDEESMKRGIGPECMAKQNEESTDNE